MPLSSRRAASNQFLSRRATERRRTAVLRPALPDGRGRKLEGIAVWIAEVDRGRVFAERHFALNGNSLFEQTLAPCGKFVGRDAERHMAGTAGTMWRHCFGMASHFSTKQEQDAGSGTHLKRGAAPVFEVAAWERNKAKGALVEGERAIQVAHI